MRFFALVVSVMIIAFFGVYYYPTDSVQPQSDPPAHTLPLFPKPMVKSELMERERVKNYVTVLLINSDFKQLEELAEHYRSTKERTPSGLWYLSLFHLGVSRYLNTVRSKPQILPEGMAWEGTADEMHAKVFAAWQAAYPNSPTPYLANAMRLQAQGWRIRGGSYAHEVPKEAWQPFFEKLTAARDHLINHRAIAARDPEWYKLRIELVTELGEPATLVMDTVSQAIEAEPYYYGTYFVAARHFLPKWGGGPQYIPALISMAAESTKEKDGMSLHARIYWYLGGNIVEDPPLFTVADPSWPKIATGMDDILRSYPDNWNINNFLYFSCMAGDQKQAEKMLGHLKGDPIMLIWKERAVFNECKDFARGLNPVVDASNPT